MKSNELVEVDTKFAGEKGKSVERTQEGNILVRCRHTTLHQATGKYFNLTTTFDWKDVTPDDILKQATETMLIRWRTAFKDADTVDGDADNQVISVKQMLKGQRPKFTKAQRVERVVDSMTPDEKRALLQKLQAQLVEEGEEQTE